MFSVHNSWILSYLWHSTQAELLSILTNNVSRRGESFLSINQFPSTFLIIYLIYFDYVATFHFVLVHEYTVYNR